MSTTQFEVRTQRRDEMADITAQVQQAVRDAGVAEGIVTVWVPHTTAGVTVNENADAAVVHDVLAALDRAVPWEQPFYRHDEGNSAAHVKSSLVGCSTTALVRNGRLVLGMWQAIYFCEFDGPRTRQVVVHVQGT